MKYLMTAFINILNIHNHDSPARRDNYESVIKSPNFPLLLCAVKWIEHVALADRLIEVWPNTKQIMNFLEKLPNS